MTAGVHASKSTLVSSAGLDTWLFWALLAVYQLPIWFFDFVPTTDGPAHLYNAELLRHYASYSNGIIGEYFKLNLQPDPTWFMHLILAGLLFVLSPAFVLKLVVAGYALLLPLGLRYAVRGLSRQNDYLALLAFPFVYGYTFHVGMFSFSYAVALSFFLIGYWLRCASGPSGRQLSVIFGLALLTYALHVVVFGLAVIALAFLAIFQVLTLWQQKIAAGGSAWAALWPPLWHRALKLGLVLLPVVAVALLFLLSRNTYTFEENSPLTRLWHFAALTALVSFENREAVFSVGLSTVLGLLAGVAVYRRWKRASGFEVWDALLGVALVFLLILMFIPETMLLSENGMVGGSYLQKRIQPYPMYALLLWLAAQTLGRRTQNLTRAAAVVLGLGMLVVHLPKYVTINHDTHEYLSAGPHIKPGSTVLPVHLRWRGVARNGTPVTEFVNVYFHLSNILGFQRELVILDNFEATMGFFPLVFRADHMPYYPPTKMLHTDALLAVGPPAAQALGKVQELGLEPDYVLVWQGRESGLGDDPVLYAWLQDNYKSVFVSAERQYTELYKRKTLRNGR